MFTATKPVHFMKKEAQEYLWSNGERPETSSSLFAGALLGSDIVRIRFLHTAYPEGQRFQLVDDNEGTLPYHSWIVATGDETWQTTANEEEALALLTPRLQGFAFGESEMRWTHTLSDSEHFYGFGEHTRAMNKRGEFLPLWNWDPEMGHGPQTGRMYTQIPFYLCISTTTGEATGVLVDHTGNIDMDMGHGNSTEVQVTVQGDSLTLYFFAGPTPADVLRQYTDLTGRMPLPPRWALGHHQGRWSYYTEQEVRDIAAQFRDRNHACESLWLDIDHMDGFRTFTWKSESFPDPARMNKEMLEQGFHMIPVINPGIKADRDYFVYQQGLAHGYLCRKQGGDLFMGTAWPDDCNFADFSRSDVRAWWGDLFHGFLEQGIAGSWNDMNEPSQATMMEKKYHKPTTKTFSDDVMHIAGGRRYHRSRRSTDLAQIFSQCLWFTDGACDARGDTTVRARCASLRALTFWYSWNTTLLGDMDGRQLKLVGAYLSGNEDVPQYGYQWSAFYVREYRWLLGELYWRITGPFRPAWRILAVVLESQRTG